MCSFYLAYFAWWNYFEIHPCYINNSKTQRTMVSSHLVQHSDLRHLLQWSSRSLKSPLQTLSTNKSRINHLSKSWLPKHSKLNTISLSVNALRALWIFHTDHCYCQYRKINVLCCSHQANKTEMSSLESIIKADSQNRFVYMYAASPLRKKYYKMRGTSCGLW